MKGEEFTAHVGIPLMDGAEVVERMVRPRMKRRGMKKGMKLELGPRTSNFGNGIERMFWVGKYL
jgi:hypothetical protein